MIATGDPKILRDESDNHTVKSFLAAAEIARREGGAYYAQAVEYLDFSEVAAERRMYLPLAGAVVLLVTAAWWVADRQWPAQNSSTWFA